MIERTFVVGPVQCNCKLFACQQTGRAMLVDPGDEAERILNEIGKLRTTQGAPVKVELLLHTHAHFDHIGATRKVKEALSLIPQIALHREDSFLYQQLKKQAQVFGISTDDPLPVDRFLEDGEELKIGTLKVSVIHTPGHSPGGVCFRIHEDQAAGIQETLLSGDTLFQESVGRTDLWGGDSDLLFRSIRDKIFILNDDTRVCPGHGPDTVVGIEKRTNPFFTERR
jgi:hydroxyacylglutathione hydrolase